MDPVSDLVNKQNDVVGYLERSKQLLRVRANAGITAQRAHGHQVSERADENEHRILDAVDEAQE